MPPSKEIPAKSLPVKTPGQLYTLIVCFGFFFLGVGIQGYIIKCLAGSLNFKLTFTL